MAKGKGKSNRRIKDWHQRTQAGQDDDASPQRESLASRGVKIPAHRLDAQEDNLEALPKVDGMVVGFFPGGAIVRVDGRELICAIAKAFRPPEGASPLAVGDGATVAVTQHADGETEADKERADGFIIARQPRRTLLTRPQPISGKRQDAYKAEVFQKVIAANVDHLLIVSSVKQPRFRRGLIDRFLIAAQRGELAPLLVINKIDLEPPPAELVADLAESGLEVFCCSAATQDGLAELGERLTGASSVVAGASGVGKSTLINCLVPEARAQTRKVRPKDERGRHTTSAAVVYDLSAGGMIIDTPGIRELGMDLTIQELTWYFPEFEPYLSGCKFGDCTHTHEPDCAVLKAVAEGDVDPRRYDSYCRILDTLDRRS